MTQDSRDRLRRHTNGRISMSSLHYQPGTFRIATSTGQAQVEDFIGGLFGLREEPRKCRPIWTVAHLASGTRVTLGNGAGFLERAKALEFAERVLPLADWNAGPALADNNALAAQVVGIWNELITRDVAAAHVQNVSLLLRENKRHRSVRRATR
jgi:hypothetical protein